MNAEERLINRFTSEFESKGLANVKFFVRARRMSVADLIEEINLFEDTVAVSPGDIKVIESIDRGFEKTCFDAPF